MKKYLAHLLIPLGLHAQISVGPPKVLGDSLERPEKLATIDLDGDGDRDIVAFGPRPRATALVWLNDGTGHSSAPAFDYDDDSVTNWEEFLFGTNPLKADLESGNRPQVILTDSGPQFSFAYRTDADALGIALASQVSTDLEAWFSLDRLATKVPENDDYQRFSYPVGDGVGREFFRTILPPIPTE